ncbi:NlpC/P60 family protein [Dietzia kunjamensis]|uniref:NlpC/P60 family protein n=1 Tax=Dietzia kunjamensis TaxID=322509 RepID=UPI0039BC9863
MEPDHSSNRARGARTRRYPGRAPGRAVLAAVLVLGTAAGAVQAPVAGAQQVTAVAPGDISGLIRAVADASARLDQTREEIAVSRESVNKSLVDLQMARIELDRAIAEADRTSAEREQAESGVESARGTLDDYSRLLHRQGTAPGAASAILDPGGPADAGLRQEYLQRAAADQRTVVGEMVAAADEAARRESEAVAARDSAEQRYSDAAERRASAEAEVSRVAGDVTALEDRVVALTRELDEHRAALAESGATPAGPRVDAADAVDAEAMRAEAFSVLAGQPEAGEQAADIASALPSHLDLGAVRQFAGGSSDEATRAIGGTIDAGSVGAAVDAGINGDTEAIVQQVAGAISRADFGSIAQGPAAPGPGAGQGGNAGTPSNSARVETVVNRALSQLGMPYAWGGGDANGPTRGIRDGGVADWHGDYNKIGFDCSGLMIYAFAGIGKALPHYTGYQYTAGPQFPVATRQRGDMLFWPGHVALYLGDGRMVEAPQSGDVVKISPVRMAGISPMVVRLV